PPLAEQIPCPNCVIFIAVQRASGNAAISSAIRLVLPTLRVCPPTTTMAIRRIYREEGRMGEGKRKKVKVKGEIKTAIPYFSPPFLFSFAFFLLPSGFRARRASVASSLRYCGSGRAGTPHSVTP